VRRSWLAVVALAALSYPGAAAAHAGAGSPAATDFVARVTSVPAGLTAKVIDGDQSLWLDVAPGLTVNVLGFSGEPYLRFTPSGVQANVSSPTWLLNRAQPGQPPPRVAPVGATRWQTVARGRSYTWHEDRLHALALTARQPGSELAGNWTLPLRIDGGPAQIRGSLWHVDPPSLLWLWPEIVAAASLPALLRLRRRRLQAAIATTLVAATLLALAVAATGRLLYGRPTVSTAQQVELGLTLAAIVLGLRLLLIRDWQMLISIVIGAIALAFGAAWIGILLHGHVIAFLPAPVQRLAVAGCLGGGATLLATTVLADGFQLVVASVPPARKRDGRRDAG